MKRILKNILLLLVISGCQNIDLTPKKILDNAIEYHDPEGVWGAVVAKLNFEESRPDGSFRSTTVWLNQPQESFKLNRGGEQISGVVKDSCFVEKGDLDCERALMFRNYYSYLWGLPMKLKDEGTNLSNEYKETVWEGNPVYSISVGYEKDFWQYYFNKETFQLVGYEFEQKNGNIEKIILQGEYSFGKWRIPAERTWYKLLPDNEELLGTDKLVEINPIRD